MASWRRLVFDIADASVEDLIVCLHEADSLGVEIVGSQVVAWFPESVDESPLMDALRAGVGAGSTGLSLVRSEPVADGFWHERWVEALVPFEVGRRFLVVPGPATPPDLRGRHLLRLTPGRAFGTGEHATTRMCVRILEDCLEPRDTFLDVGTGSGILAIAAAMLGAGLVVGLDTDAGAVDVAARNAIVNDVHGVFFAAGPIDALAAVRFDVVAANITGAALERAMPSLERRTSRVGVLSGILHDEEPRLLELAARSGFRLAARMQEGDWLALQLERHQSG